MRNAGSKILGFLVVLFIIIFFAHRDWYDVADTLSYYNIYFSRQIRFEIDGFVFQLITWPFSKLMLWKSWLFTVPLIQLLLFNRYIRKSRQSRSLVAYALFFAQFFLLSWLAGTLRIGLAVAIYLNAATLKRSMSRNLIVALALLTHWSIIIFVLTNFLTKWVRKDLFILFIGLLISIIIILQRNYLGLIDSLSNIDTDYNSTYQKYLLGLYFLVSILSLNNTKLRKKSLFLVPTYFVISDLLFFDRLLQIFSVIISCELLESVGDKFQKGLFVFLHIALNMYFLLEKI